MKNEIEMETLMAFGAAIRFLREDFPEFAREIDRCAFDVGKNHIPQCGHATCDCQTMTFERFHTERNIKFAATARSNR